MNAEERNGVSSRESVLALTFLGAATLLRLPYTLHYRFNSDEPQHLHVVWAWTRGLLPYRDVFDNHSPLFHALMAPLLALIGERADALTIMRFAMIPFALLAIWLTYLIAVCVYGRRVAIWSAVLLGIHYEFFFKSIEFRSDNLWTVGWLATLAVIVSGPPSAGRALATGALLGTNLCVSQKTLLMVGSLAGAAVLTVWLSNRARRATQWARAGRLAGASVAGFVVAPLAVGGFFATQGAYGALVYGAFKHNILTGLGAWHDEWRPVLLVAGLALTAWLAFSRVRSAGGDRLRLLRVLIVLTTSIYVLSLETVWPLVTGQDYLPLFPLLAILIVSGLHRWERHLRERAPEGGTTTPLAAATLLVALLVELGVVVLKGPVWRDRASSQTALVADVLKITDRDDPVMDTKGETIFRTRPFPWVLETITIARLSRGLIPDTIAEDMVRAHCYVAVEDSTRFPSRGRAFLNENFVSVGALRVAGRILHTPRGPRTPAEFEVAIPGRYAVVTLQGTATGTLDGATYSGPRVLGVGPHEFVPDRDESRLAVVWARAVERGLSPFGQARDTS